MAFFTRMVTVASSMNELPPGEAQPARPSSAAAMTSAKRCLSLIISLSLVRAQRARNTALRHVLPRKNCTLGPDPLSAPAGCLARATLNYRGSIFASSAPCTRRMLFCAAKSEFLFSSHFMERALYSALLPGEEAIELVGEALAVGVVERRRAAGALPRLAQLVQVVAQRQALLDVLLRIELPARIERVPALGDHVRGERNIGRDDEIARRQLAHDMAIRDVDAARHLQRADVRRRRRAQQLVRHQRQRDLRPLRRAVEDILDDRGTRVGVDPNAHGT